MIRLADILFVFLAIATSICLGIGWWACFTAYPVITILITIVVVVAVTLITFMKSSFCIFEAFDSIEEILDD